MASIFDAKKTSPHRWAGRSGRAESCSRAGAQGRGSIGALPPLAVSQAGRHCGCPGCLPRRTPR